MIDRYFSVVSVVSVVNLIMKWIEAKVIFDHQDDVLASDLIADVFSQSATAAGGHPALLLRGPCPPLPVWWNW